MKSKNIADENYATLAKLFPNALTEDDSVATNFEQIFVTYSPKTVRKVL